MNKLSRDIRNQLKINKQLGDAEADSVLYTIKIRSKRRNEFANKIADLVVKKLDKNRILVRKKN